MFDDLDGLHERIKNVFAACRQAVTDELAQQQDAGSEPNQTNRNSQAKVTGHSNGSSNEHNGQNGHRASQKQLDYAQQLAGQIRGLGVRRLEAVAQKMFSKPLADLTSLDASGLIDVLKEIKAGKLDLAAAIQGTAA